MPPLSPYMKAIVGGLMALIAGLQQAFPGNRWVGVATLALTPVLVYLVPNVPASPPPAGRPPAPPSQQG
jgi:hypothetical protein